MTEADFAALLHWARTSPEDHSDPPPRGCASLIESVLDRALERKCNAQTQLTLDRARDLWVEKCFSRPWWRRWLVRTTRQCAATSDAIPELTRALRRRAQQDAEEVHRSNDPEYKWARQKLSKALRDAAFSRQSIARVQWAAPPGRGLVEWPPAESNELMVLVGDASTSPGGKQAKAHWLVDRWRAHLERRAQIWRVTHLLKQLCEPSEDGEPIEVDDWCPDDVLAALEHRFDRPALIAGLQGRDSQARRHIRDVVMQYAADEADARLKLGELAELLAGAS